MLTFILCDRRLATFEMFEQVMERLGLHSHKSFLCPVGNDSREEVLMLEEGEEQPQPMMFPPPLPEPQVPNAPSKVYICGIGRDGIEMAHKTALRYPNKVAGVLLCPDETGFEGTNVAVKIEGGDESLALLLTVQPGLQPKEDSSVPYTVVELVRKDGQSSTSDFVTTQGKGTELGLETEHHLFDGDLESLIQHPNFPKLIYTAVDEAEMLAR